MTEGIKSINYVPLNDGNI